MSEQACFHFEFSVTGQDRKRLVRAISDYIQDDPKYLGAPSFLYQVDNIFISRQGSVSLGSGTSREEIAGLIETLQEKGFTPQACCYDIPDPLSPESIPLVIKYSREAVSLENLIKLLQAKGSLMKKAFQISHLPVKITAETVSFPWFKQEDADTDNAHRHFIYALCKLSKERKRITAVEREVENEKYAFRCFLLQLGFIGPEYKTIRKSLLKNLSGNGSYRSGNSE